jgi:hypothetical protein
MNGRVAASGRTRVCPHCKTVILESASVCPGCQHHLRFDPKALVERRLQSTFSALRIEGDFRNPEGAESWVARKVVGVGALAPSESRSVTLSVDVFAPGRNQQH